MQPYCSFVGNMNDLSRPVNSQWEQCKYVGYQRQAYLHLSVMIWSQSRPVERQGKAHSHLSPELCSGLGLVEHATP